MPLSFYTHNFKFNCENLEFHLVSAESRRDPDLPRFARNARQFENDLAISLLFAPKSFVATLRVVALRIFAITRIVGEFAGTRRQFCCATASVCVTLNFIFIFLPQHPERKASTAVVHFRDAPSIRTKITRSIGGKPQPFRRTGIYNKCDAFSISTSRISPN